MKQQRKKAEQDPGQDPDPLIYDGKAQGDEVLPDTGKFLKKSKKCGIFSSLNRYLYCSPVRLF